jgi:bifunctional pyridoxal-dependent enzyme with beta-cystathionase and maltose regulon repressor activities
MSMSFDFDTVHRRQGTDSLKWGRYRDRDVIPMWVADMSFPSPAPILEALHRRVEHGIFGYATAPPELVQVVVARLRERYRWEIDPAWIVWLPGVVPALNVLGFTTCLAAYRDCEAWRLALIDYLRGNRDIVQRFIKEEVSDLAMDEVQATYLAWIDTRRLGLPKPARFFEHSGVALDDGREFQGEGFVRLNFGCPRSILREALDRLRRAAQSVRTPEAA